MGCNRLCAVPGVGGVECFGLEVCAGAGWGWDGPTCTRGTIGLGMGIRGSSVLLETGTRNRGGFGGLGKVGRDDGSSAGELGVHGDRWCLGLGKAEKGRWLICVWRASGSCFRGLDIGYGEKRGRRAELGLMFARGGHDGLVPKTRKRGQWIVHPRWVG
jgi:hypothetical protein